MDGVSTTTRLFRRMLYQRRASQLCACGSLILAACFAWGQSPVSNDRFGPSNHGSVSQWMTAEAPLDLPQLIRPQTRSLFTDVSTSSRTITPEETSTDASSPTRSAASGDDRPLTVEEALEVRGTISFRNTPLSEAVFLLSDLWHINIVAGENVSGEVSGTFHDAPLREVLSAALTAAGYSYRQTGNSLIVLPVDQVGSDDPNFQTATIDVPAHLLQDASTIQAARLLLGARGQLQQIGTSAVLVVDSADRITKIRTLFEQLSPASETLSTSGGNAPGTIAARATPRSGIAYFSPQYTDAEEMAEPLQTTLGATAIVATFPSENRIMVKGSAEDLRLASEAIEQLDKPRPQVRITAMIYDVALAELEQLGVNWSRDLRVNANVRNEALENLTTSVDELFRFNADLTTTGAASMGVSTITDTFAAAAILEALDNTSESKLLADPSITVGDRREASIRIVRRIPIVGANPVEGSNAVFTQTEFEEAGIILRVTPRISCDGTIDLQVSPEYSVVAELTANGPVIDSRTANTTVRVGNGQMFVLGGLRQKTIVESVRGIPYLKDVKYVGKLFRSHDTEVRESELIVFLRPEIITPYYGGSPRQHHAAVKTECQLNAIPHATSIPQTPYCQDPSCPNHHPRPRINGGSFTPTDGLGFHYDHSADYPAIQPGHDPAAIQYGEDGTQTLRPSGDQGTPWPGMIEAPLDVVPAEELPLPVPDGGASFDDLDEHSHARNSQPPSAQVIAEFHPPLHIDSRMMPPARVLRQSR